MAASTIEHAAFRDMFGHEPMRVVFDESAQMARYLDVEAALARVQARLGMIPAEAADAITAAATPDILDMTRLAGETRIVGYPILPLVRQLSDAVGEPHGGYVHWGATTQDIMDSGVALQVQAAHVIIEEQLTRLSGIMARLTADHAGTVMAGRTHLQHALPVTFGYKVAVWASSIERMRERLVQMRPRVEIGQFAGAAGTLASLGDQGLAVSDALMDELGLGRPSMPWHAVRDTLAEAVGLLALITGALAKIAYDVMMMMTTELAEVAEPFVQGRGGSSTMPQKRNPISSEVIFANAKVVRQHAAAMYDAMVVDFERATGPWHVEWLVLPEAYVLTSGALEEACSMLDGLEVDADRMRHNLDATGGLIVAEAVMMALAPTIGRQKAHDVVYDACRQAIAEKRTLADVLADTPGIGDRLDRAEIDRLTDPAGYLGEVPRMIERFLASRPAD